MIIAKHDYQKKNKQSSNRDKTEKEDSEKSPKTKKRKKMDESIEIVDEIWSLDATIALKQLEKHAKSRETVELITCFDVDAMEKNCYEKTMVNIKRLMQTWNEKDNIMINAIKYVNDGRIMENIKTLKTEELISYFIISIRNRMPKMCGQCNDWYRIEKDSEPILRCIMCDIGIHECKKIDKNSLVSGLVWICHECSADMKQNNIMEIFRKKLITEVKSNTTPKDPPVNRKNNKIKIKIMNERKEEQNDMDKIEIVLDALDLHNVKDPISLKDRTVNERTEEPPKNLRPKVCTYWVRNQCKFGTRCIYAHPDLCNIILENGTCNENDCKGGFHPKMCNEMKNTGHCSRGYRCFFTHIKKVQAREHHIINNNIWSDQAERRQSANKNTNYDNIRHPYMNNEHIQTYMSQTNGYNHVKGPNADFLGQQNTNWQAIRERAAEILAEKMWNNQ